MQTLAKNEPQIFTVGHSNRSFEEFLFLLKEFQIATIADIRRFPGSKKFPHFNRQIFPELLKNQNIQYIWFEALGGRRHTLANNESHNMGLKSPGFRNYADHMLTDEFRSAVSELLSIAAESRTAIMCAEKFFWKCHRRLLSDYLFAQGAEVIHITELGRTSIHKLTHGVFIDQKRNLVYLSG
jgi:uncharacterized protein (DUF488 family)